MKTLISLASLAILTALPLCATAQNDDDAVQIGLTSPYTPCCVVNGPFTVACILAFGPDACRPIIEGENQ